MKVSAAVAGFFLVLGLVLGFSSRTASSWSTGTVDCGAAFAPASFPDMGQEMEFWEDTLGYVGNDALDGTPSQRATTCAEFLDNWRNGALVLLVIGTVGLLAVLGRGIQQHNNRISTDADGALDVAADEGDDATAASTFSEAYWRARGWAPAEEVEGPPPGWVRVGPSAESPE